jgi:rsbT co-antagonist protein RsbR
MTIHRKLLLVAGLNLVLLIGLGLAALAQSAVIDNQAISLGHDVLPALEATGTVAQQLERYRSLQGALLAARNPSERSQVEQDLRAVEQAMQAQLSALALIVADDAEEQALFEHVRTRWSQFSSQTTSAFLPALQSAAASPERATAAYQQLAPLYQSSVESAQRLSDFNTDEGRAFTAHAQATYRTAQLLALGITLGALLLSLGSALLLARQLTRNLSQLSQATAAVAAGDLDHPLRVESRDEVGQLAQGFRAMLDALRTSRAMLAAQQQALETRGAELEQTVQALQTAIDTREEMRDSLRALSCPVVPVLDGVLVMPLIGQIDDERAALLLSTLLDAVQEQRAHTVFLDITGVPMVDTQVAQTLMQVASTVQLLGARAQLVGLRPEVAQTIVGLGLDLTALRTFTDLRSGIRRLLGPAERR